MSDKLYQYSAEKELRLTVDDQGRYKKLLFFYDLGRKYIIIVKVQ